MFTRLMLSVFIVTSVSFFAASQVSARNHVMTILGGDAHFRGSLAEGACVVSAESQDMHVDMGQYRNDDFNGVGSESSHQVSFLVHLTDCNPELANRVGISFYGMTDPKEPDAFLVTSGSCARVGGSGGPGFSGLGLIIRDAKGSAVVPYISLHLTSHIEGSDMIIPFTARYRATSREINPGMLRSDIDFRLVYP